MVWLVLVGWLAEGTDSSGEQAADGDGWNCGSNTLHE
jgi:hypothetical protein